jgi:hypothetical protein
LPLLSLIHKFLHELETGDPESFLTRLRALIDEKGYLIPYTADRRKVFRIGANFDAKERNLGEWVIV